MEVSAGNLISGREISPWPAILATYLATLVDVAVIVGTILITTGLVGAWNGSQAENSVAIIATLGAVGVSASALLALVFVPALVYARQVEEQVANRGWQPQAAREPREPDNPRAPPLTEPRAAMAF
jgi:hypothetical protein